MGEAIAFRLEGSFPSNWDEFKTYRYEFHDQPSEGLDVDYSSVRVSLLGADGSLKRDLTTSFEVVSAAAGAGANGREWSCQTADLKAAAPEAAQGDKVVLSYEASLDAAKAAPGTSAAQRNLAYIDYTSKPFTDAIGRSKESEATVSTWALDLAKVDATDHSVTLSGAKFTLQTAGGAYVSPAGGLSASPQELSCDSQGRLEVTGIGSGTYTLTEVTAPEGYALPEASWHVTLAYDASGSQPRLMATVEESGESFEADVQAGVVSLVVPNAKRGAEASALNPTSGTPNTGEGISAPFVALVALGILVAAAATLLRPRDAE